MVRLVRCAYKGHDQTRFIVTDHGAQFRDAFKERVEIGGTEVIKGKVRSCTFDGKAGRFFKALKPWQRVTVMFANLVDVQKKLDVYRT